MRTRLLIAVLFISSFALGQIPRLPAKQVTTVFSPTLYFVNSGSNPTIPDAAETNAIMQSNGTTCDNWYRYLTGVNSADTTIYYTTATNALLDNWSLPGTATNVKGYFPTVFQIGTTYYMFIKQNGQGTAPADFTTGDIYLWSSTNKTTWTVMNGGSPVITHSATTTDWRNRLYNVGVAVVGTTLHILVEGLAASGSYSTNAQLGYATADISSPTFTLTSTPQIENGYNPDIIYVPEKNSLLVVYNTLNVAAGKSYVRFIKASLTTTLTNVNAWSLSPYYATTLSDTSAVSPHYPSDFSIVFTPGKTYPAMATYNYDQAEGYQTYMPLVNNALELFESIPNVAPSEGSEQFLESGSNLYTGNKLGIGGAPTGDLDVVKSATGAVSMTVKNTAAGSGNYGTLSVQSDASAIGVNVLSSTWSSSGIYKASGSSIDGNNSGGISIANTNASGVLRFYTGGSADANERMRVHASGGVSIGNTTDNGAGSLLVSARMTSAGVTTSSGLYAFGTLPAHFASTFGLDYFTGKSRLWSYGADASTKGNYEIWGISSDGSAYEKYLNLSPGVALFPSQTVEIDPNSAGNGGLKLTNTGGGNSAIGFGGMTSASAANAMMYSDGNYVNTNSKAGSALYLNFDNANSSSTVNMFNGKFILTQPGALKLSGYGAGTATFDGSGNITSSSDRRVKNSIRAFNYGLASVMKLKPSSFIYNGDSTGTRMNGFIAQDVQEAIPGAVHANKEGILSLETTAILAALVNAVKEQQVQIDTLKKEISALKK